jgi:hypothetical protein
MSDKNFYPMKMVQFRFARTLISEKSVISNKKLFLKCDFETKLKLFQKSVIEIFSHFFCVTKSKSVLKMYQCANEIF